MTFRLSYCVLSAVVCLLQSAAKLEGGESAGELVVFPAAVSITSGRDIQRILVLRRLSDGSTEDVTAAATLESSDPQVFRVLDRRIQPVSDGSGRLQIRLAEATAAVPVTVTNSAEFPELNFRSEVLATLTKAG
ncbi:MAG: hypothetical protein ACOVRM_01550, partial [Planctomycetaceae bacterium]